MTEFVSWQTKYLNFWHSRPSDSGKTDLWFIQSKSGDELGEIRWHGPWRKYVFRTINSYALFDGNCLRDIVDFCESRTEEHKEKA
jgi:hypothetical protein